MKYVLVLRNGNKRLNGWDAFNTLEEAENEAVNFINLVNTLRVYINSQNRDFLTVEDIRIVVE